MSPLIPLCFLIAIAAVLALVIAVNPRVEHSLRGRVLAFVALVLAPVSAAFAGLNVHMERSKTVDFCLSCHSMEKYGRSLHIDDVMHLPAAHYQYNRVPHETACFACHTNYTLFGDEKAKFQGLHHILVEYFGKMPKPEDIKLYQPFNNRECLHCHEGARSYMEAVPHKNAEGGFAAIKTNKLSCMTKGCHDLVHDLPNLDSLPQWSEAK
jgi:nitrate/TMAO reductase-like tetraheme cytochrome c subunit